jgi:hypothetical protein
LINHHFILDTLRLDNRIDLKITDLGKRPFYGTEGANPKRTWMNLSGRRTRVLVTLEKSIDAEGANPLRVKLSGKRQGRQFHTACLLI